VKDKFRQLRQQIYRNVDLIKQYSVEHNKKSYNVPVGGLPVEKNMINLKYAKKRR
jgi:hypothetical protein